MQINIIKLQKYFIVFPLLILLILLINTRFTLWPEMMVYPYLYNNGFALYTDLINPYFPTLIIAMSFFSEIFNYSIISYQLLTWTTALIILFIVFFISLKISKSYMSSLISVSFFTTLAVPFGINELWFDLIQTPFILLSVYFLYKFSDTGDPIKLKYSLLFFIPSFFIKQQSAWILIFILLFLFISKKNKAFYFLFRQQTPLLVASVIFFIFLISFWHAGTIKDFLFWTIYFPFFKASSMPGYLALPTLKQSIVITAAFLLYLPLFFSKNKEKIFLFVAGSAIFFAYPRFDYFHLLPTISILSVVFAINVRKFPSSRIFSKIIVIFAAFVLFAFCAKSYLEKWSTEVRFFENDIRSAATFISLISNENDKIYILNGPDQILPLASRLPTKPWADEFPWYLEFSNVQGRVVSSLEDKPPDFVVYKPYENGSNYSLGSYKPQQIVTFIKDRYEDEYPITETLWLKKPSFNKD